MEIMKLSKNDINNLIEKNKHNINKNRGGYGIVLPYNNEIGLKFSADLLKNYYFDVDMFNNDLEQYKISERQIDYMAEAQEKVRLTSLPKGIAYYNKKPVAIIIKYFYNHKNLYDCCAEHSENLFKILKEILIAVDELMGNGIYQLDIKESNFMYSKNDYHAQPIDLDGEFVKIDYGNSFYEHLIYEQLIEMYNYLFKGKLGCLRNLSQIDERSYNDKISELECLKKMINSFDIYERTMGFLEEVKEHKILEIKKTRQ